MLRKIKLGIYLVAKTLGLFALARRLTARFPRILCYHGGCIGDEWKYNGLLFMRRATFAGRINWLQRHGFVFARLEEVLKQPGDNVGNRPLVVLTFDDGWYSTGSELIPVLSQYDIPSTLYLSTKRFQDGNPVLPVVLGYLLWKAKKTVIHITGIGKGVDGKYDTTNPSEQKRLISNFSNVVTLRQCPPAEIESMLNTLLKSLDVSRELLAIDTRRFNYMTFEELKVCASGGCNIEMHGHVHHYPKGDPDKFEEDLKTCATVIRGLEFPTPRHYCYPSGGFDNEAANILARVGANSATTCIPGLVDLSQANTRYYLPRFLDGESIHMLEFEAEMSGFSEIIRRVRRKFRPTGKSISGLPQPDAPTAIKPANVANGCQPCNDETYI